MNRDDERVVEGMKLQTERRAAGARRVGWKSAFGTQGGMEYLGALAPGQRSIANGANQDGSVIVGYALTYATKMGSLKALLRVLALTFVALSVVWMVQAPAPRQAFIAGQIAGITSFATGTGLFGEVGADTRVSAYANWILSAVPEPQPWVLWLAGLPVLGYLASRRRRED